MMDDPKAKLNASLKEAMIGKDIKRRDVIRTILSAIKQVEIDTRKELTADDSFSILQKEAKKRRESIEEMEKAGRTDLADNEKFELGLIEEFLPKQLSRDEVTVLVREAIDQTGVTSA